MADDTVVAFKGAALNSDRRADFLREVAAQFDKYAADYGEEPQALAFYLGGANQQPHMGWITGGESVGYGSAVLAMAGCYMTLHAFNKLD